MSYDLAVWEGARPPAASDASAINKLLMDRMEQGPHTEPTPRIRAFVEGLLAKWPDITDDEGADSPWADGPLINNADGDAIYIRDGVESVRGGQ